MAFAPEMGDRVRNAFWGLPLTLLLFSALPVRGATYYLTVAGLGGEPEYDQQFTGLAKDLDKLFKTSGGDAHVYTLTGKNASRARLTETLGLISSQAKPEDDFVLILIGHGSYDGVEYKFNLVGPDVSTANPIIVSSAFRFGPFGLETPKGKGSPTTRLSARAVSSAADRFSPASRRAM